MNESQHIEKVKIQHIKPNSQLVAFPFLMVGHQGLADATLEICMTTSNNADTETQSQYQSLGEYFCVCVP